MTVPQRIEHFFEAVDGYFTLYQDVLRKFIAGPDSGEESIKRFDKRSRRPWVHSLELRINKLLPADQFQHEHLTMDKLERMRLVSCRDSFECDGIRDISVHAVALRFLRWGAVRSLDFVGRFKDHDEYPPISDPEARSKELWADPNHECHLHFSCRENFEAELRYGSTSAVTPDGKPRDAKYFLELHPRNLEGIKKELQTSETLLEAMADERAQLRVFLVECEGENPAVAEDSPEARVARMPELPVGGKEKKEHTGFVSTKRAAQITGLSRQTLDDAVSKGFKNRAKNRGVDTRGQLWTSEKRGQTSRRYYWQESLIPKKVHPHHGKKTSEYGSES